jgi:hypothetical protein
LLRDTDRAWARDYNADLHAKSLNKASVLNLLDKIDGDEDTHGVSISRL